MIWIHKSVWVDVDAGTRPDIAKAMKFYSEEVPDHARITEIDSWSSVVGTEDQEVKELWTVKLKFEWEDFE